MSSESIVWIVLIAASDSLYAFLGVLAVFYGAMKLMRRVVGRGNPEKTTVIVGVLLFCAHRRESRPRIGAVVVLRAA